MLESSSEGRSAPVADMAVVKGVVRWAKSGSEPGTSYGEGFGVDILQRHAVAYCTRASPCMLPRYSDDRK